MWGEQEARKAGVELVLPFSRRPARTCLGQYTPGREGCDEEGAVAPTLWSLWASRGDRQVTPLLGRMKPGQERQRPGPRSLWGGSGCWPRVRWHLAWRSARESLGNEGCCGAREGPDLSRPSSLGQLLGGAASIGGGALEGALAIRRGQGSTGTGGGEERRRGVSVLPLG